MRILFAASVVAAAFALYACSSEDPGSTPSETDGGQDAPVAAQDGAPTDTSVDADADAPPTVDASDGGCVRNEVADSNCSSQSRQAYLCPGDAGQPACDFFTGLGEQSLYCCE